jgi:hypothetical protein
VEMERAVNKRDNIIVKYSNKDKNEKTKNSLVKKSESSGTQVGKNIQNLKQSCQRNTKAIKDIENEAKLKGDGLGSLRQETREMNEKISALQDSCTDMSNDLIKKRIDRMMNIFYISSFQNQAKKYDELINNKAKLSFAEQTLRR